MAPGTTFRGQASFDWIEDGAFSLMRTSMEPPGVPSGVAISGTDATRGECYMLDFDERGVSRTVDVALQDNVLTWSGHAPEFAQRYTGPIQDGGPTIEAVTELSYDGSIWERDLEWTYRRVS
jgi:hypothetical protein